MTITMLKPNKMKKKKQPSLEEHFPVLNELVEVGTDDFFYTRLKGKIENRTENTSWSLPLRPSWIVGLLLLLLAANCFTLLNRNTGNNSTDQDTLESLAKNYDQVIYTY